MRTFFSFPSLACQLMVLCLVMTFSWGKDISADAWSYHYYSGSQLFENRLDLDYFAASAQGYFNPLVHAPFAAMVRANWPDRLIGAVMALYSALALIILAWLYHDILDLKGKTLYLVLVLSLLSGIIWCCVGSSTADLFLQIPCLGAILCLFKARRVHPVRWMAASGVLWGVALGLKLSAVIYGGGVLALLGYWYWRKYLPWLALLMAAMGVVAGFALVYGWWGIQLYHKFGNPFFPFLNNWFLSPDYTLQSVPDRRFLSWDLSRQLLLPFRIAGSEVLTYIEFLAPDIRPGVFVVLALLATLRSWPMGRQGSLTDIERDFVVFLFIVLYTWVLLSGNGRYATGLLLMLGAGIYLCIKAVITDRYRMRCLCAILALQAVIFYVNDDGSGYHFSPRKWGGRWYDNELDHRFGDELVLMGIPGSNAEIIRAASKNTAFASANGAYRLDLNPSIERLLSRYQGRVLGVMTAVSEPLSPEDMGAMVSMNFSRFGLVYDAERGCFNIHGITHTGAIKSTFLACHLKRDMTARETYLHAISPAMHYLAEVEKRCPDILAPVDSPIGVYGDVFIKKYGGSEISVYYKNDYVIKARKFWSLAYFDLGDRESFHTLSNDQWRKKYCLPIVYSGLFPEHKDAK